KRAVAAYQTSHHLTASGEADCDTWNALGANSPPAPTMLYEISDGDVNGSFQESIPRDLVEQAKLSTLGYTSIVQELADRFHTSPDLLRRLNPSVKYGAGDRIVVPAVDPSDPDALPPANWNEARPAADLSLEVSK